MDREEWRMIPGYEGLYMVSNKGRVKSLNYMGKGKTVILKLNDCVGYKDVVLSKDGIRKHFKVHRLVAMAFIPNPNNLPQVNHKDENPLNNCVDNLEWCTQEYNNNYGTRKDRCRKKMLITSESKQIAQYTLDGRLVKIWDSMRDIERELGYSSGHICRCCKGQRKTAYGFIWTYAGD